METVCVQCGDRGFTNAFVYCVKCLDVAVHRYCLDVIPAANDEFVRWICDACEEEVQNQLAALETDTTPCQTRDHTASKRSIGFSRYGTKKNDKAEHHNLSYNDSLRSSKKKKTGGKGINLSNGRNGNRESEVCTERNSATPCVSKFCKDISEDSNISSMVDRHARAERFTTPIRSNDYGSNNDDPMDDTVIPGISECVGHVYAQSLTEGKVWQSRSRQETGTTSTGFISRADLGHHRVDEDMTENQLESTIQTSSYRSKLRSETSINQKSFGSRIALQISNEESTGEAKVWQGPSGEMFNSRCYDTEGEEVQEVEDDAMGSSGASTGIWQLRGPAPGGPVDITLTPSFAAHTAFEVWKGKERSILQVQTRLHSLRSWRGPTDHDGVALVHNSGLSHLRDCMFSHHNVPLLCAFIERWQPETNSFHMPFGEMTITLHDVHYILGLSIEGNFVSSSASKVKQICAMGQLLGMTTQEIQAYKKHGGLRFKDIRKRCSDEAGGPVTYRVAGYLIYLLGSTLFVDKSKDRTTPVYVALLEDLSTVGQYAWGPAALAYLYRQLGIASRAGCKQLSGCLTLFETWIYEYFPKFRPARRLVWKAGQPRANRWQPTRTKPTQENLVGYRLMLDRLGAQDVVWMPYGKNVARHLPRTLYHGTIRYHDVIEPYMPDRVLRQFGFMQIKPADPIKPVRASRPRNSIGYKVVYPAHDALWNTPAAHSLQHAYYGVEAKPPFFSHPDYLEWYVVRTHPWVQNPLHGTVDVGDEKLPQPPDEWAAFHKVAQTLLPLFPENRGDDAVSDDAWGAIDQCAEFIRPFIEQMPG